MPKVDSNIKSDKKCRCGKLLKKNVVDRKPTARECYQCHRKSEALRGHHVDSRPRQKRLSAGQSVKNYSRSEV